MTINNQPLPEFQVSEWLNSSQSIQLADLRGRVVLLHAFQMLCPGCVSHGLPQAVRVHDVFDEKEVAVIGLHTVFEHHEIMTREALRVFVQEYQLRFPIGIDRPVDGDPIPLTMRTLALRGTPSTILIDKSGQIRMQRLGQINDMVLGYRIGKLIAELGGGQVQEENATQPASTDSPDGENGGSRGLCHIG